MGNAYWFYHKYGSAGMQRTLLIQKQEDKEDAKEEDIRKSYRGLGATVCGQLQAKKASDVEIIVSEKVANKDLLGIFENSLILSNYENSHKKQPDAEEESEKEEVDKDERTKRVNKKIDNLQITVKAEEEVYNSKSSIFQRASAKATTLARDLANARGSVGTPCYMEEKMVAVAKGHKNVKEIRVLDAQ